MTHPSTQTFATAPSRDPHASLLRRALAGNAVFSTLSGLCFALMPERIAELYSASPSASAAVRAIGIGLLLFAAIVANEARQQRPRGVDVLLIAGGDAIWVLATLVLVPIFWSEISTAGAELALAVALVVALFCALQVAGLRAHFCTPRGHARSARHCVLVEVDAAPDARVLAPGGRAGGRRRALLRRSRRAAVVGGVHRLRPEGALVERALPPRGGRLSLPDGRDDRWLGRPRARRVALETGN